MSQRKGFIKACGAVALFAVAAVSFLPEAARAQSQQGPFPNMRTLVEGQVMEYSIRLTDNPSGDVMLTTNPVTIPAGVSIRVEPRRLVFTPSNGTAFQYVTITVLPGTAAGSVTIQNNFDSGILPSGTPHFSLTVATGSAVTLDPTALDLDEGATDTFTVRLVEQLPGSGSTIVGITAPDGLTVDPEELTFTTAGLAGNWNTPQTVTVTAGSDADAMDELYNITAAITSHSQNNARPSTNYDNTAPALLPVTIQDDDAGILFADLDPADAVFDEGGGTFTYDVTLNQNPGNTVTITINVPAAVAPNTDPLLTVNPTTLEFTSTTYSVAQEVMVTAGEDADTEDTMQAITHSVALGSGTDQTFANVPDTTLVATITDDDITHGVVLALPDGTVISGMEEFVLCASPGNTRCPAPSDPREPGDPSQGDGSSFIYTVALLTAPSQDVMLSVTRVGGGAVNYGSNPETLDFTTNTWNIPQTISVTGQSDGDDALTDTVTHTWEVTSGPSEYTATPAVAVMILAHDESPRGELTASPASLLVPQGGNVVYSIDVSDGVTASGGGSFVVTPTLEGADALSFEVSPTALTFVDNAGVTAQNVTVSAMQDSNNAAEMASIVHSVMPLDVQTNFRADTIINNVMLQTATPGIVIRDSSGSLLPDSLASGFMQSGANSVRVCDGAGDPGCDSEPMADFYTVELATMPSADVILSVSGITIGGVVYNPDNALTLDFSGATWNTPRTISVSGTSDSNAQHDAGDHTWEVVTGSAEYDPATNNHRRGVRVVGQEGAARGDLQARDAAGSAVITTLSVPEDGSAEYLLWPETLARGTDGFTVSLTLSDTMAFSVSPSTLEFATGAFQGASAQTVTVYALSDDNDANETVTLSHSTSASSAGNTDSNYIGAGVMTDTLILTSQDNDRAGQAGVILTRLSDGERLGTQDSNSLIVCETSSPPPASGEADTRRCTDPTEPGNRGGLAAQYSVQLLGDPGSSNTQTITVRLTLSDGALDNIEPFSDANPLVLSFSRANWNVPQTVSVVGKADTDAVDNRVILTATATGSGNYATPNPRSFQVIVRDTSPLGTLTAAPASLSIGEGGTATYTITAGVATDTFTVRPVLGGANPGSFSVSPETVTFSIATIGEVQTFTVTALEDNTNAAVENAVISHTITGGSANFANGPFASATVNDVAVVSEDNDGFTVSLDTGDPSRPGSLEVGEESSGTYTLVLDKAPVGEVSITYSISPDIGVTAMPNLVFDASNWNEPQTVTVAAPDDDNLVHEVVTISHTVGNAIFTTATVGDLVIAILDNDGRTVDVSPTSLVIRNGNSDNYTVVLGATPGGVATVTPTSADTARVTVEPAMLTFTDADYNIPKTFSVTAVEDTDNLNNEVTITHAVLGFGDVSSTTPVVVTAVELTTVQWADSGMFPVSESTANPGGVCINLVSPSNTLPIPFTLDVAVVPGATNPATAGTDFTTAITTLTFNDNNPQCLSDLAIENDDIDEVDEVFTVTVSTPTGDDPVTFQGGATATVTITDDDTAGVDITLATGSLANGMMVDEGAFSTYEVALQSDPGANTTVTVTPTPTLPAGSADGPVDSVAALTPAVLSFDSSNWETAQTIRVEGVEDTDGLPDDTINVANVVANYVAGDGAPVTAASFELVILDDDTPVITASPDNVTIAEGGNGTFTVVLGTQPGADITVTPNFTAPAGIILNGLAALTFTNSNWNSAQNVVVSAPQDPDGVQGDVVVTWRGSGGSSAEERASWAVAQDMVTLTVTDDEHGDEAVTITPAEPTLMVVEETPAANDYYTIVLDTQPVGGDVNISMALAPNDRATVVPTSVDFGAANWNVAQTVRVLGTSDADAVDDGAVVISHTLTSGSDYGGGSVDPVSPAPTLANVNVQVTDDDPAELRILDATGGLSMREGRTRVYGVRLSAQPLGDNVVVTPVSSDTSVATLSPSPLTFTSANWDQRQDVTVSGVEDADATEAGDVATITHATTEGNNAEYAGANAMVDVSVTETDSNGVVITAAAATLTVTEGAADGSAEFTVSLSSAPTGGDVTVRMTATPPVGVANVTGLDTSLVFGMGDWNAEQTVTLDVTDDLNARGGSFQVSFVASGGGSGDDAYGSSTPFYDSTASGFNTTLRTGTVERRSITLEVIDPDVQGITVTPQTISITEVESATYTLALDTQPVGGSVEVRIRNAAPASASMTPERLEFTEANWNMPQTVRVSGSKDDDGQDEDPFLLTYSTESADPDYAGLDPSGDAVTVTVTDVDVRGVMRLPAALTVDEDEPDLADRSYELRLSTQPYAGSGAVTVTMSSDNSEVTVNPTQVVFQPNEGAWQEGERIEIIVRSDDDAVDPDLTTITHAVSGSDYNGVADTFVVVTPKDDERVGYKVLARLQPGESPDVETPFTIAAPTEGRFFEYDVKLTSEPSSGLVTITPQIMPQINGEDELGVEVGQELVFTTTNWNVRQQVIIRVRLDGDAIPENEALIDHRVTASVTTSDYHDFANIDPDETEVPAGPIVVLANDSDTPEVVISPLELAVIETSDEFAGQTATYTVKLMTMPSDSVTVTMNFPPAREGGEQAAALVLDGVDTGGGTLSYATVVIRPTEWSREHERVITVAAAQDEDFLDGTIVITHTVSGAPEYTSATGNESVAERRHPLTGREAHVFPSLPVSSVTVTISDPQGRSALDVLNEVILSEVTRAITDQQIGVIARRVQFAARDDQTSGAQFSLGGQSTLAGMAAQHAKTWVDDDGLDMKQLFSNSDFSMPLNALGDGSGGGGSSLWGGGDYRNLGGDSQGVEWSGSLFSGHVGLDTRLRDNLLTGLMLSYSEADIDEYSYIDATGAEQTGVYELDMTTFLPYIGWTLLEGKLEMWAALGVGQGDVEITPDNENQQGMRPPSTGEATTRTAALGGSGELLSDGDSSLRLKGEAFITETAFDGNPGDTVEGGVALSDLDLSVSRLRLALEAERAYPLAGGGLLAPSVEAGVRFDGGDGETGAGLEIGGGVHYHDPSRGMTLESRARALFGHSGNNEDWGVGGSLHLSAGEGGQGLALSMSPGYGNTASTVQSLWDNGAPTAKATNLQAHLNTKIAYGAYTNGWLLTPYSEMTLGEDNRKYSLGMKWDVSSRFGLNLSGERKEKDDTAANHGVWLKGEFRF